MANVKGFTHRPSASGNQGTACTQLIGHNNVFVLAANTVQSMAVPTGATVAVFTATGNFWVRSTTFAAAPTVTASDGTAPQLNPSARDVADVASIFIVSDTACSVGVVFYA